MGIIRDIEDNKLEAMRLRRRLHSDPETAFAEKATARLIIRTLQQAGISCKTVAGTGIVGVLHGRGGATAAEKGKRILLHTAIDALPQEETAQGRTHTSVNKGVHHGAGRDGETAMLLAAAKHLAGRGEQDRNFTGTVYFLFQPAGETMDGAIKTLKEDFFTHFPCDAVYSLSHTPDLPLGTLLTTAGDMRPASEEAIIQLCAEGEGANTVKVAASLAATIERIHAENFGAKPTEGFFRVWNIETKEPHAGESPREITLSATFRAFDGEKETALRKSFEQALDVLANDNPTVGVYLSYKNACPVLHNDKAATDISRTAAESVFGTAPATLDTSLKPESFAFFQQKVPGNFAVLGTGGTNPAERTPLRSSKYDFNDAAIPLGASYWVRLVETFFSVPTQTSSPSAPQQRF